MNRCKNCGRVQRDTRALCWRCTHDPAARAAYLVRSHEHEPTMAVLDALVAEQSKPENLPAWWHETTEDDR